jgi:RNA polymerase sigma factor (sigma-70 family)
MLRDNARKQGFSSQDAEAFAQEALTRALEQAGNLPCEINKTRYSLVGCCCHPPRHVSPRAYIFGILRMIILENFKKNKIHRKYHPPTFLAFTHPSFYANFAKAFAACLEGLSDQDREIFLLYYVDGYTQQEIADRLGIPRRTVANRLQKSTEFMMRCLESKIIPM